MKCSNCGQIPETNEDVIFERGYFWHKNCHIPDSFPGDGKLIPETILRYFPDDNEKPKKSSPFHLWQKTQKWLVRHQL